MRGGCRCVLVLIQYLDCFLHRFHCKLMLVGNLPNFNNLIDINSMKQLATKTKVKGGEEQHLFMSWRGSTLSCSGNIEQLQEEIEHFSAVALIPC